jgi:hypothetical protein
MAGIEIRNYEGDGSDLVSLIRRNWQQTYGGRMWFPDWDIHYLRWRYLDSPSKNMLVCAYDRQKLVGCLLAVPAAFRFQGRVVSGSLSSCLSVDNTVQSPTIGIRLVSSFKKLQKERELSFSCGCTSSEVDFPNRMFWDSLSRRAPRDYCFFGKIHFWIRVLNGCNVATASLNSFERIGAVFASHLPALPLSDNTSALRDVTQHEKMELLRLRANQVVDLDLAIEWDLAWLERELIGGSYAKCQVIESISGSKEKAFVVYYHINFIAKESVKVTFIDLVVGNASMQRALLNKLVQRSREDGVDMVMLMKSHTSKFSALLSSGFLPLNIHQELLILFPDESLDFRQIRRLDTVFT